MGNVLNYSVSKVSADGTAEQIDQKILKEFVVHLFVNDIKELDIFCTNLNIEELVIGRLYAENKISKYSDINNIDIKDTKDNEVDVYISLNENINIPQREKRNDFIDINHESVMNLVKDFSTDSKLHTETSSTHSCYLSVGNEIVFVTEDISRHNAVDKSIGYMLKNNLNPSDCIIYSSGRVPLDMIEKVGNANIPILVAKALPTNQSIEYAKANKLVLIAKAVNNSYEIFTQKI